VLDGIVKYPWPVDGNEAKPAKWGFYCEEGDHLAWAHEGTPHLRRSVIAEARLNEHENDDAGRVSPKAASFGPTWRHLIEDGVHVRGRTCNGPPTRYAMTLPTLNSEGAVRRRTVLCKGMNRPEKSREWTHQSFRITAIARR